ncbi:IS5 family transposase [Methylocaldum szegediense]|uniref:Transposase n=1 Tax=Methylocaldum szegediense TaxID=73780 RepID=A0ABM9HWT6_9GAMM|nr:IS5 family transposase [Methylocaldum szegediense]CAI8739244.1 transposase [Methylocaldum szegediense]
MRGADITQQELFSYRTLEERIPKAHPLRKLRAVVDRLLTTLDSELDALYARTGRESIPPERLLRASLIQVLFSIRSERQLAQQIEFNLLYRWFVGLTLDAEVWDHSSFSANRDRLLNKKISRQFFERVVQFAEWQDLLSDEHFSVDGTLIQAWASMKSFVNKEGSSPPPEDGGRNPTVDFKGEKRSNATHASTTDPEARLYKKSEGDKAQLCFMGHALMENRSGLVVDVEVTHATGTAERDAAKIMIGRTVTKPGATVGADKAYDVPEFVHALRKRRVTPHVARKDKGSAIDGRTTRHPGYRISQKRRKRVEELFGWSKTVGGLRQTRFRGLKKVAAQTVFTFAAYNLTRLGGLFGWRWSTA